MKTTKTDWSKYRERIVRCMSYFKGAPASERYAVQYGSTHRFGADTFELTERVLKEAKSDARKTGAPKEIRP